jgi:hypothetical protein
MPSVFTTASAVGTLNAALLARDCPTDNDVEDGVFSTERLMEARE